MKKFLMPLVVLMIAAIISVILYFTITETYKDWQTTTGTITNVEITIRDPHGIGGGGKQIHYYWVYNIDGFEYSGYDNFAYNGPSYQSYREGDEKEIWYNPDNHSESQFTKPSPDLYVCIPFIFAIPIMMAVYHLQAKKENRNLQW